MWVQAKQSKTNISSHTTISFSFALYFYNSLCSGASGFFTSTPQTAGVPTSIL